MAIYSTLVEVSLVFGYMWVELILGVCDGVAF